MKQFTHKILKIPKCTISPDHLYITEKNNKYKSVTQMIQNTKSEEDVASIQKWRDSVGHSVADFIFRTSAKIGKETHILNENYLNNLQTNDDFLLLSHAHHQNFIAYLNKIDNIYGTEVKMYSDSMRLAGTADCIAEYDGVLSIIDYKTKRSSQRKEWLNDYFLQATAYSEMLKEHTQKQAEQLVILVSSEKNTMQEFTSKPIHHIQELYDRVKIFHKQYF